MRESAVIFAVFAVLLAAAGNAMAQGPKIHWVDIPQVGADGPKALIGREVRGAPEIPISQMQAYTDRWTRELRQDSEAWQRDDSTLKTRYLNAWTGLNTLQSRWAIRALELEAQENKARLVNGELEPLRNSIRENETRQKAEQSKFTARLKDIPIEIMMAGKIYVGGEESPSVVLKGLGTFMEKQASEAVNGQLVQAREVVTSGGVTQETQSIVSGRVAPFTGIPYDMYEPGEQRSSTYYQVEIYDVYPKPTFETSNSQGQDQGTAASAPESQNAKSALVLTSASYKGDLPSFYRGADADVLDWVSGWLPRLDDRNAKARNDIKQARKEFQDEMARLTADHAAKQTDLETKECELLLIQMDLVELTPQQKARGSKCPGFDPNRTAASAILQRDREELWPKQTKIFLDAQRAYRDHFSTRHARYMNVWYGESRRNTSVLDAQIQGTIDTYDELVGKTDTLTYEDQLLIVGQENNVQVKEENTQQVKYSGTPSRLAVLFTARPAEQKRAVLVVGFGVEVTLTAPPSLAQALPAPELRLLGRKQCNLRGIQTLLNLRIPLNKIAAQCNILE